MSKGDTASTKLEARGVWEAACTNSRELVVVVGPGQSDDRQPFGLQQRWKPADEHAVLLLRVLGESRVPVTHVGMRPGRPLLAVGDAGLPSGRHPSVVFHPCELLEVALGSLSERERRQVGRRGDDGGVDLSELGANVLGLRPRVRPIALVELVPWHMAVLAG